VGEPVGDPVGLPLGPPEVLPLQRSTHAEMFCETQTHVS
jgi:hypothetical protein